MSLVKSLTRRSGFGGIGDGSGGRTDLLLRFFESQFFDEWIALQ